MKAPHVFGALALLLPARALAATPDEAALAEELFRQAKQEMEQERWDDACPKLAESYRLDPGGGTILTLALCHESQGRTAAAWAEFGEAIAFAKRDGRRNRESIAMEHMEALRPRLVRLHLSIAPETVKLTELVIERDGIEIKRAGWAIAAPIDPGEHTISAHAPGYEAFHLGVNAQTDGATVDVTIPPLVPLTRAGTTIVASPANPPRPTSALRVTSYVLGGIALAAFGVGTWFGLAASSDGSAADARCPTSRCNDPSAVTTSRDAGKEADIATGAFVVGAVALAAGVACFVLSIDSRHRNAAALTFAR